jgi:hypothetical protein
VNNGAPLPEIGPAIPDRAIAVNVNVQHKQIQVLILDRGHPVPGAAIAMTIEQAKQHALGLVKAIEMAQGGGSSFDKRSGLIMPGDLIGGKPFRP